MARLRADIWCAAFMRRHNDIGNMCVVARKGDPVAGQIWVEVDHLNGTISLYTPAPAGMDADDGERRFEKRYDQAPPEKVSARIQQEIAFDPDVWVISLEMRTGDPGLAVARPAG